MIRDLHHGKSCPYCQRPMHRGDHRLLPTQDHVIPKARGGQEKIICCQTCNGIKADLMPNVWAAFMRANPCWWQLSRVQLRVARRKALGLPPRRTLRRHAMVVVPPELIF